MPVCLWRCSHSKVEHQPTVSSYSGRDLNNIAMPRLHASEAVIYGIEPEEID